MKAGMRLYRQAESNLAARYRGISPLFSAPDSVKGYLATEARKLVYTRLASGASFLRDLAYTAWIESAQPVPPVKPIDVPNNPENPRYSPATGSAPAPSRTR